MRIKTVHYATYPLGGDYNIFAPKGIHNLHVGLHLVLSDNTYRELHYDGDIHEAKNQRYDGRRRAGLYKVCDADMSYQAVRQMVMAKFHGTQYAFGKRDCWTLVEWFVEEKLGIDKANLSGPIGERRGLGNGIRHLAKDVGREYNNTRHEIQNVEEEMKKLARDPVNVIRRGIERPDRVVKNITKQAARPVRTIGRALGM